tara:strand:+ start:87 stop:401 length:315 start_codon:yes stop_codon:yes gene_type:complete
MDHTHSVEVKELNDGSGDTYIEFPPELLNKLGWKEGDDLRFEPKKNGSIRVKKVNLETIELDFDEDELFKYMQIAHDQGISFNEFCENALKEVITKAEFENECG